MPKLASKDAQLVEETESTGFEPVPAGIYPARLVDVSVGEGAKGPYWKWEYEILVGYEHAGRKFWNITSLSPKAAFKMKETFEAFGVSPDTDTDLLLGKDVTLQVGVGTIQSGERTGQSTNVVNQVLPFVGEEDEEEPF